MTRLAFAPVGAMVLRLTLGSILLVHGLTKVLVYTIPGTVSFFASIGLPAIAAYMTIFAELAGGAALLAGIWTRVAAVLLLPLLGSTIWYHYPHGFSFTSQGGGWEYPALLFVVALVIAIQGGGTMQLDSLLKGRRSNRVFGR